ncbi:MAG: ring-cleaving dioxygenase [Fimbriimonadaceae bacterium]|nr:ring-cleaving dioxygenase [Fimbriimonadaceae bacterium]
MSTHSIHHVTAVTAKIAENLAFYTQTLGLRLVKRSVNQDDVSAYHLFYADAVGSAGTDMTFFDWPMAARNVPGPGTIALTRFRVPEGSLDWWESRLNEAGASPALVSDSSILFGDPEGQALELTAEFGLQNGSIPWTAVVPESYAIGGILGVDLNSARPESTRAVLTQALGYQETSEGVFDAVDSEHQGQIRIVQTEADRLGRVGAGGVHHVAFRVSDEEELLQMRDRLDKLGLRNSGLIDRYYFKSLYFREPGGVLFEMATDGPGFASDEPMESLGERLALPPFLEPRRAEIEAGLKPLPEISATAR